MGRRKATAGYQSAKAKHNLHLPGTTCWLREIGEAMLQRLWEPSLFICPPPPARGLPADVQLLYRRGGSFDFHRQRRRDIHGGRERVPYRPVLDPLPSSATRRTMTAANW